MASNQATYPFDPTGKASSNKISNEPQVLSPANYRDFQFVVPNAAPFFGEGTKVVLYPSGQVLKEGQDFFFSHLFRDASLSIGKPIYGSISFYNKEMTGSLGLTYQTLGGTWTLDEQKILEILSNSLLNPRTTTWDEVADLPEQFPPINHDWSTDDLVGMSEVVTELQALRDTLLNRPAGLDAHIENRNNPHHVSKAQVGLGLLRNFDIATIGAAQQGNTNEAYMTPLRTKQAIESMTAGNASKLQGASLEEVRNGVTKTMVGLANLENYPPASQAQAREGTRNDLYMTPLRVKQALEALGSGSVTGHVQNKENPHEVTKAQVGLGSVQNYGIASESEAIGGESTTTYLTPYLGKLAIQQFAGQAISGHTQSNANPHSVTKGQVGLGQVQNYGLATRQQAEGGTNNGAYMTPLRAKEGFDKYISDWLSATKGSFNSSNPTYPDDKIVSMFTARQIILGQVATAAQAAEENNNSKLISPAGLAAVLSSHKQGSDHDGRYYTKTQADERYVRGEDLGDTVVSPTYLEEHHYTKTQADNRYATKNALESYYTKTQADDRYMAKNAAAATGSLGGLKARLSGSTLYLRNDDQNA